jgi:hypothetical protein
MENSMERIITVTATGVINVRTMDEETHYNHRYCLIPNDDLTGQPEDVVTAATEAWTPEVVAAWNLAHPPPTAEELAQQAAIRARQQAKAQAFIDNLPSWAVVGGKFDTMLTAANAATNLAQAKAVLIELIKVQKKMARVLYWSVRNSEE